LTPKRISGIAAIIGIIAILLIPQALTPDSFAAMSKASSDPHRHFADLTQPEDPDYVEDTIGDVKIRAIFKFNKDGAEVVDSFRIINQLGGYHMPETIEFQLLGGVGKDKTKLYTATDKFYAQGQTGLNNDYRDFDVDVYLFQRGDDVAFRHFMYLSCDIIDYSVATLHDGDETFSGLTKFVLADAFTFQCSGYHPHCPTCMVDTIKTTTEYTGESSSERRDTQTWSDLFKYKKP
jgi:hypothetical protein